MAEFGITDEVDAAAVAELRERVISYNLAATGLPNGARWAASSETRIVS
jgi:hypothetical protein